MAWAPYSEDDTPSSHGRITLAELLTAFCDQHGHIDPEDLEGYFDGKASETEWTAVTSTANFLGIKIQQGHIRSFSRLIGGGVAEPIRISEWELDDFVERFRSSAYDPKHPFDATATPTVDLR